MRGGKSLDNQEQTVARNVNIRGDCGEVSDRNEEYVRRNWKKGGITKLCSSFIWKIALASDKIGYLTEGFLTKC